MKTGYTKTIELPNITATDALAVCLAKALLPGVVIYLHGDLGAGKTTLVRALLAALGHTGSAKSPTYTLVESYEINDLKIEHFDLYRLNEPSELEYIGVRDYLTSHAVCIFEWAEKGSGYIPTADLDITLEFSNLGRKAVIQANSATGNSMLQGLI